jgi:mRNA interferase MazF
MVAKDRYIPNKGEFIALSFDPQAGHEQKGRRPALVISNNLFNRHTGLAVVCPVTNTFRKNPFHVQIPAPSVLSGYVMVEQVKSIDYLTRRAQFIEKPPAQLLDEVLAILDAIMY